MKQSVIKRIEELERRTPSRAFGCHRCAGLPYLRVQFVPDRDYYNGQSPPTERCPSCDRALRAYWPLSLSRVTPQQERDMEILKHYNPLLREPGWRPSS